MVKKAIVLVSFGTLRKQAEKSCVEVLTDKITAAFPGYVVKNVFTSSYILKKLNADGKKVFSLAETLEGLLRDGIEAVMIQPTLLTEGEEYSEKILHIAAIYQDRFRCLIVGKPVLTDEENAPMVMEALIKQSGIVAEQEEVVLMGHGSKKIHNPAYSAWQMKVDQCVSYMTIGVLEDDRPDFHDVVERLRAKGRRAVYLMPLLFVTGMHVREDLLGDGERSWKTRLINAGFRVRVYDRGLGENECFQAVYLQSIRRYLTLMR